MLRRRRRLGSATVPRGRGAGPVLGASAVARFLAVTGPVTLSTAAATAPAGRPLPPRGSGAGPTPSTATTAKSTAATSTIASTVSIPLGTSGVHADLELPAVVLTAVQRVNRVLGVALLVVPDEGKAPAAPGLALLRHVDVSDLAVLLKQRLQILGHSTEWKVANSEGVHTVYVTGGTAESAATSSTATIVTVRHIFIW